MANNFQDILNEAFDDTLGAFLTSAGGEAISLAASAARTADGTGTALSGLGDRKRFIIVLDVTAAATEVNDTLDVYVDVSLDGTTYLNAVHFTQVLGNGGAKKFFAVLDASNPGTSVIAVSADASAGDVRPALFGPYLQARWVIVDNGADNASFTFSVTGYAQ